MQVVGGTAEVISMVRVSGAGAANGSQLCNTHFTSHLRLCHPPAGLPILLQEMLVGKNADIQELAVGGVGAVIDSATLLMPHDNCAALTQALKAFQDLGVGKADEWTPIPNL